MTSNLYAIVYVTILNHSLFWLFRKPFGCFRDICKYIYLFARFSELMHKKWQKISGSSVCVFSHSIVCYKVCFYWVFRECSCFVTFPIARLHLSISFWFEIFRAAVFFSTCCLCMWLKLTLIEHLNLNTLIFMLGELRMFQRLAERCSLIWARSLS